LVVGADGSNPDDRPRRTKFFLNWKFLLAGNASEMSQSLVEKKIFLIDGNSQAYQAYYAIKSDFTAPDGLPTNATYGFTLMLLKILREKKPDYILVAFDTAAPTFRHKAYVDYKAQRKGMPDDLVTQFEWIKKVLAAYRIKAVEMPGYEADDVLGTLARRAADDGLTAVIVTRDKDALQLLGDNVLIWDNRKDEFYSAADLQREMEIRPSQVVDMMAFSGDVSDNVPGIPGVGPKTALALIQQYGSFDEVYKHVDEIKGPKLRANLVQYKDDAVLSRELVTIDTNVPIDVKIEDFKAQPPDAERLAELFRRLDFRSLPGAGTVAAPAAAVSAAEYILVDSDDKLAALVAALDGAEAFAFDTETTGLSPIDASLVGMSFAVRRGQAYYVPVLCPPLERCLAKEKVFPALKPFLEDPAKRKIGQNLKYDILAMKQAGVQVRGAHFDTMVAAYVVDPGRHRYNLGDLTADYLAYTMIPIEDLIGKGKKQITMDMVSCARVAEYSGEDAEVSLRLARCLEPEIARLGEEKLFRDVEMPLVEVLARMEATGVRIDCDYLSAMSREFEKEISGLEARIYKEAGREFNIASPKQLADVLFEERKLSPGKRTKTAFSTDVEVLERLAEKDELARLVLEYRSLTKLKGTYLDALPRMVSPKTGRVHCSFNQTGTATGRLSSSDPNLQNIPIRTELGKRIRRAFVTEPGCLLLAADYSQIELRITAHLSGDRTLIDAFKRGEDIHNFVARQIYGVDDAGVTSEMRRTAKAVNFGIIYGQSPYGLSRQLGIPIGDAAQFIDAYFARYPGVEKYIVDTLGAAKKNSYVSTILGRRRYVSGIEGLSPRNLNSSERIAINTTIQGSAADMIKLAMLAIDRRQREAGSHARMILQIHDELVFEMPEDMVASERPLIESAMANALELSVPVVVNVGVGPSWLEAEA
jgi:DNA polymerase I